MQPKPMPGTTNDVQDAAAESATLDRVLWLYPTHLTERELLVNLLAGDGGPWEELFERAVRGLVADGLLRIDGESILPTRAALRSAELAI
jgi:hypothetical protein